ncbi:hypothetical protein CUAC110523_08615 [Cutibacterium acnes subsp. defendens]|nr:hypothetical protein HMPREF1277_02006 [Propionibacterium sp. KPL1847]ERS65380.1 hypothetical protein HMPREF1278_02000 [Propionibacterium sp. KPL1849]
MVGSDYQQQRSRHMRFSSDKTAVPFGAKVPIRTALRSRAPTGNDVSESA